MQTRRRITPTSLLLGMNGLALTLALLVLLSRDGRWSAGNAAYGQAWPGAGPATGNGLSIMPAQLSPNTYGCYVMDAENQTLSVYQFQQVSSGVHELRFTAARDIRYDRKLKFFNTSPSPTDVKAMVERSADGTRAVQPTPPAPGEGRDQN